MPDDLTVPVRPVPTQPPCRRSCARCLDDPTRWRLILTVPDSAPREYRDDLRRARSAILARAELLAKAGIALDQRLDGLDAALLGHTMLSFAEMLGRLAVNDAGRYPRERLESYAMAAMGLTDRR